MMSCWSSEITLQVSVVDPQSSEEDNTVVVAVDISTAFRTSLDNLRIVRMSTNAADG
jgi:hypothetical protein